MKGNTMSTRNKEEISPEELRKRLYQTFKTRGILDTLKIQLRNQLIHELKQPLIGGDVPLKTVIVQENSFLLHASNSLVADHLQKCGYEYSLSVFYPESGLEKTKKFLVEDILHLLKVSPKSELYNSLNSNAQNEKGFLMTLLMELTDHHVHKEEQNAETQTETTLHYRDSLVEKMQIIDEQFAARYQQGCKWEPLEIKLIEYRKEVEEQIKAEMEQKFLHFKEVELAKIKMEEKEKSHKEIAELRRELNRTYQAKSEALINREKTAIERLQKQQEIEEKEIYSQRQALLAEIETLRNREAEYKQRIEAFEMNCKILEDKNKIKEDSLRQKELMIKNKEDAYEQKLKNELLRYQLELKEEYLKRTEKITEDEKRIKVETTRLKEESAALNQKKEDHKQALSELKKAEIELDFANSQLALLTQQNDLLKERLNETTDYPLLKRENLELQAQTKMQKKHLEEAQEEICHLREELSHPSSDYLALQAELRRHENAMKLDEEEFKSQKQLLERQLQNEVENSAQLKAQLIDCEEKIRWLNSHVEDLKTQLRQTQQALENEVFRNPKPSLVDRSVLDFSANKIAPPDIYIDRSLLRGMPLVEDVVFEPSGISAKTYGISPRTSSNSDMDLIAEAKARIRELEKEAETLQEAYRHYQQKAVRYTVTSSQSPALSPALSCRIPSATHQRMMFSDHVISPQTFDLNTDGHHTDFTLNMCRAEMPGQQNSSERSFSPVKTFFSSSHPANEVDNNGSLSKSCPQLVENPVPLALSGTHQATSSRSSDMSPLGSPHLKSTTREYIRSEKMLHDHSSESSPEPEKLSLEDLAEPVQDASEIPEQLGDDLSHHSGAGRNRSSASSPVSSLPQEHIVPIENIHQQETPETVGENVSELGREDTRHQEVKTAIETEQSELEKLEHEMIHKETSSQEESEVNNSELKPSAIHENSSADQLEKYLKIVMESKEQEQNSLKDTEEMSPAHFLTEEKDDSIASLSHDAADEDFW
ncbi:centriole and centriolar satellite protein ofd1 isoform X1 [Erpetoichthys calabaricus]|uniref:OFD1 centriole and centriolar satellite protein n=2 Tax=Erpetoichthys calabaricus TaxID=27687 RepID=A0A8C4SK56_ERPCA|nr:centriole and centriolar satellite protein ofd1 isoform X1 [Erpetoichthys calabaricus]